MLMLRDTLAMMLTAFALVAMPAGEASAQEDNTASVEVEREARALIEQLGAAEFRARQEAARQLESLGIAALPYLRLAADHADLEIRYRARDLIERVLTLDHERRLELFQSSKDPVADDLLPGWKRFREAVGSDDEAKALFAEMQRAESRLFRLLDADARELGERLAERVAQISYTGSVARVEPPTGRVAALLFIASDKRLDVPEDAMQALYSLVQRNGFVRVFSNPQNDSHLRRVVGLWVGKPSDEGAYLRVQLGLRFQLKECLVPALRMIQNGADGRQLQYAIAAVGKLGGDEHIEGLESLLADDREVWAVRRNGRTEFTSQVRDIALAALLYLTDQDPKTYGFPRLRPHAQYLFVTNTAGFNDAASREQALARWKQWRARQKSVPKTDRSEAESDTNPPPDEPQPPATVDRSAE